jgi:hypothetical protein
MASLPDCAAELATSHELESSTRSRPLLPILRECEVVIERARSDLAEAARLDYGITHAAEWLLDNAYLIRSNIADIRHNLPDNHNKILPVLTDRSSPVRLRVYHLAAELIDRSGHRLAADTIVSFLNAYQHQFPLTIAELWVFPLMLRLVLLERLRRLAELAILRQHQKELADFWADRLLNAAHRTPEQFEEMVAELDRRGDQLTPHFIARLGEQLHQEESALAPIQKWIQRRRNTAWPISSGPSMPKKQRSDVDLQRDWSLRQLSELQYPKIVEAVSRMEAIAPGPGRHSRSDFATRDLAAGWSKRQRASRSSPNGRGSAGGGPRATRSPAAVAVRSLPPDEGLPELEKRLRRRIPWRERWLRFLHRHPTCCTWAVSPPRRRTFGAFGSRRTAREWLPGRSCSGILALFPASELATPLQMFLLGFFRACAAKMSFEEVPEDCRTLSLYR